MRKRGAMESAVPGMEAFLLRFFGPSDGDRCCWSSEDPRHGGRGTARPEAEAAWRIPGHAALLLRAEDGG